MRLSPAYKIQVIGQVHGPCQASVYISIKSMAGLQIFHELLSGKCLSHELEPLPSSHLSHSASLSLLLAALS